LTTPGSESEYIEIINGMFEGNNLSTFLHCPLLNTPICPILIWRSMQG